LKDFFKKYAILGMDVLSKENINKFFLENQEVLTENELNIIIFHICK